MKRTTFISSKIISFRIIFQSRVSYFNFHIVITQKHGILEKKCFEQKLYDLNEDIYSEIYNKINFRKN